MNLFSLNIVVLKKKTPNFNFKFENHIIQTRNLLFLDGVQSEHNF